MTNRKNLKITADTYEALQNQKREMETWDSYLRRVAGIDSGIGDRRQLVNATVQRFVEEKASVEKDHVTPKGEVYYRFLDWCEKSGYDIDVARNEFGRALTNLDNHIIEPVQRRIDGEVTQMYAGLTVE